MALEARAGIVGYFGLAETSLQETVSIPGILPYAYITRLADFVSCFIFASLISRCSSTLI
jgi:hypothetical protein